MHSVRREKGFVPFGSGAGESLTGVQKDTPLNGGAGSKFKAAEQVSWNAYVGVWITKL